MCLSQLFFVLDRTCLCDPVRLFGQGNVASLSPTEFGGKLWKTGDTPVSPRFSEVGSMGTAVSFKVLFHLFLTREIPAFDLAEAYQDVCNSFLLAGVFASVS